MQRREFLSLLAATPALTRAGRLFAAPMSAPRFLLVFLRGGYDCANVLVPYASDFYYEARPNIAIARPAPAEPAAGALALDSEWALAPALRDTLGALYRKKQALFIPFAGTDDLSRSHFETQDSIERGLPATQHDFRSGFMGRLAATLAGRAAPIAFTDSLPLAFRGSDTPNVSLRTAGKPAFDARQSALIAGMYAGHHLHAAVEEGLDLRQHLAEEFPADTQQASRGAVNARGFAAEGERIGRLMREQYRLGFVDIGGWDTHVNEGGAQGQLANNLEGLGRGLVAFADALGDEWNNTVVAVISEFGRTFRENGNKGTDHGHGTAYWMLGGALRGGRIAGAQVKVDNSTLLQNRDFPVLNDYRALLGGLFARLWGLDRSRLQRVFPQTAPLDLQLV